MTWQVDSTVPITAANQATEGRIRLHPGACADLRALLTPTADPDEFLLPVGWTLVVAYDEAADQTDYWYKAPDGRQWTDRQCGTAAFEGGGFLDLLKKHPWLVVGALVGGYFLWKMYAEEKPSRK